MPKVITTRSDVLETEYESSLTKLIVSGILLLVSLFFFYLFGRLYPVPVLAVLSVLGAIVSLVMAGLAGRKMYLARSMPTVTFPCPYCDYPMQFLQQPTEDFDCENCHRRVYFENGQPVEVRTITCTVCGAVHKISAKVTSYTCDRCNRQLKLSDTNPDQVVATERSELLQNYDVILTQIGRNRNDVALALQSILICNLPEARRQMENLPLTLARNVPERKAYAIRNRIRELGATAVMRPTQDDQQTSR